MMSLRSSNYFKIKINQEQRRHPSFAGLHFFGVSFCMVAMLRRGNPPEPFGGYAFPRWSMGTRN
jgi:hypothetical protein